MHFKTFRAAVAAFLVLSAFVGVGMVAQTTTAEAQAAARSRRRRDSLQYARSREARGGNLVRGALLTGVVRPRKASAA